MVAKISDTYGKRQIKNNRVPNTDLLPFVAKTKKNGTVYPVYLPYDATNSVQGVVWLSDSLSSKKASNGMTAMTPAGVKDNTINANATKDSNGNIVSKTVTDPSVTFVNEANFSGNTNFTSKPTLKNGFNVENPPTITVNWGQNNGSSYTTSGNARFNGKDMTINLGLNQIPLAMIPQEAQERVYVVDSFAAMLTLTTSQVQNGDTIKINGSEATSFEEAGKVYIVRDQTKLNSFSGIGNPSTKDGIATITSSANFKAAFVEFSAGIAAAARKFDKNKTIQLRGDCIGSWTGDGSTDLWEINTTVEEISKEDIANIFGVTL